MKFDNKGMLRRAIDDEIKEKGVNGIANELSKNDKAVYDDIMKFYSSNPCTYATIREVYISSHVNKTFRLPLSQYQAVLCEMIKMCQLYDVNLQVVVDDNDSFVVLTKNKFNKMRDILISENVYDLVAMEDRNGHDVIRLVRRVYKCKSDDHDINNSILLPELMTSKYSNDSHIDFMYKTLFAELINQWCEDYPDSINIVSGETINECFDKMERRMALVDYDDSEMTGFYDKVYNGKYNEETEEYKKFVDVFNIIQGLFDRLLEHGFGNIIETMVANIKKNSWKKLCDVPELQDTFKAIGIIDNK